MRVAIVGGGLAGLTCAKYLAESGFEVSLYEGLPYLGGRASVYKDDDGDWVEQGLHLFLGVYSEFRTLLREIGQPAEQILCWTSEIRLQDPAGSEALYGINPLAAPFRTVLGFLGQNGFLGPIDKLTLLPLVAPGVSPMEQLRQQFDGQSVVEWWRRAGGSPDVLERFIRPFCRAIQFTDAEDFSAYNFLGWIHHVAYNLSNNFLCGYRGSRDEIIFQPLARHLHEAGVRIRTGAKLKSIDLAERQEGEALPQIAGLTFMDGTTVEADAYVMALPAWALAPVLPAYYREKLFFRGIAELPVAPAISVQLFFDRRVCEDGDFRLVGRSLTPVYQDQSTNAYPYARGSRLSVIVSPADDLLDHTHQQLVTMVVKSLAQVQPAIGHAGLVKSVVLRHKEHLIRPLPGAMSARPTQETPVPNLFLAGDWTQQAFFGSQEGAVRGGKACARAIARRFKPELRVAWLEEASSHVQRG